LGAYSAAAIASFAFGEPVPAVDGNVYRILSRVYGVFTSIDSTAGKKEFFALANELIPKGNAGRFNQAIIDLVPYNVPQNYLVVSIVHLPSTAMPTKTT